MRNAQGYSQIFEPGQRTIEHDTANCRHCGRVMLMKPGLNAKPYMVVLRGDGSVYEKEAGFCRNCFGHICPACDGKECKNYFAKLDEAEKIARKIICEGL